MKYIAVDDAVDMAWNFNNFNYIVKSMKNSAKETWLDRKTHKWTTFNFEYLMIVVSDFLTASDQKKLRDGKPVVLDGLTLRYAKETSLSINNGKESRVIYNMHNFVRPGDEKMWGDTAQEQTDELINDLTEYELLPTHWKSSAGIAESIMENQCLKAYMGSYDNEAFYSAYYGARIEAMQFGMTEGQFFQYDINAAYAAAMQDLPDLSTAVWEPATDLVDLEPYALYYVRYRGVQTPSGGVELPHPLPHRSYVGGESVITFPKETSGWYWGVLINSAKEYTKTWGGEITVMEGLVCKHDDSRPFAYIKNLYDMRETMRADKNRAEKLVKTIWQTTYGKLCQQKGWKEGRNIPQFFELAWAGYITAFTQAKILDAIAEKPQAVIMVLTDAIFTSDPLNLPLSNHIGEWKSEEYSALAVFGIGRYIARKGNEWQPTKCSGIKIHSLRKALSQITIDDIKEYFSRPMVRESNLIKEIQEKATFHEFAGTKKIGNMIKKTYEIGCWDENSEGSDDVAKRYHDWFACPVCESGEDFADNTFHPLITSGTEKTESEILRLPWFA